MQEVRADLLLGRDTLSPGLIKAGRAAADASGNISQLTRDLYEVSKQRATPVVDLEDTAATAKLAEVTAKLSELSAKTAEARATVDDKDALAQLAGMQVKLDTLGQKVSSPRITLDGVTRAEAQLFALDAALDKIDGRTAEANVKVDVDRSLLSRLGGAVTGQKGLFGGAGGFLSSPLGIGGIAGGGILAAGLAPGAIGLGLGGLAGLGAVGGGLFGAATGKKIIAADQANIKVITTALKSAIGKQKDELSQALKEANKKFTKDMNFFAPFLAFQGAIKNLAMVFLAPLRPIMGPLTKIFQEFGKSLATLGPMFTQLFQASLPFLRMFLQFLLQAGSTLLPTFTKTLNDMVKSGALDTMFQGLATLTEGLGTFIRNLGPGMTASAKIFARIAQLIGDILGFLGDLFTVAAKVIEFRWGDLWKVLVVAFRAFRSIVATVWDTIWRNTVTRVQNGIRAVMAMFGAFRNDIATVWNTIWRNTVTRVQNGIDDVVGWFKKLPGRVINALMGLGTMLYNWGHMSLTKLWNGMKNVFSSVWNWFKSLPGKLLNAIGINSPPQWAIDAGKHIMGGILKGVISRKKELMGAFGGVVNFNPSLGVQQWGPLVRRALIMEGLNPLLAARVMYQMQTESGGNPNAINLTDSNAAAGTPSKGLLQVIDPTFRAYHWPGTSWNIYNPLANIAAALNYARHRYGPTLMSGGMGIGSGHGYASGTLGARAGWAWVGERGPELVRFRGGEQVYPAQRGGTGRGGGGRVVLEIRGGHSAFDQFMINWLRKAVIDQGGGDAQVAFGSGY